MTIARRVANTFLDLAPVDHRVIGAKQRLFLLNESSQGSCFFLPRGAHIYNKLIEYLRGEYRKRKYEEVITPNIFRCDLWKTSGHWDHYKDNMMKFNIGDREFSLKPMNCPAHCLMFKLDGTKTSADLPVRWADFGALHRHENSGSLLGLTRVRRFQQDDAHIFCTPDQVETEVRDCLEFAHDVYNQFDFTFDLKLSLRPKEYMGDIRIWDKAEQSLQDALKRSKLNWEEQPNEGAFYGPKIDLVVKDCRGKTHQCATIQLDFQLPERFELVYKNSENKSLERPVIIHRAILGSIERFFAMIAENYEGRWPFWLSPLQAKIIPVNEALNDYAVKLENQLLAEGFMVEFKLDRGLTFNKKVRDAEVSKYNFILVVGNKEAEAKLVTVRVTVDKKTHNFTMPVERLIELFRGFKEKRVKHANKELLAAFS